MDHVLIKKLNDLGKVRFFSSKDLKNWKKLSDFDRKWVYECMDMVELEVDGDPNYKKWLAATMLALITKLEHLMV